MKLKPGMLVTVRLDGEELRFLIVATGGDGTERLSLKAPLAKLLSVMMVGDTVRMWTSAIEGAEPMRVELVKAEEAPCS